MRWREGKRGRGEEKGCAGKGRKYFQRCWGRFSTMLCLETLDKWREGKKKDAQGREWWLVILKMLQLFKILQLIWQLVLFKMIQLQGANPMTPIEVKSQQLIIFKNASASGASPLTPFVVKSHIFSLKCFQLLIWQPVISKLLQLQGASPLTPIEVTSHIFNAEIDVILKSPWPPLRKHFTFLLLKLLIWQTCYLKNASASGGKPPGPL